MGKYAISSEYNKIAKLNPPVSRFVLVVSQKFMKASEKVFRGDVIDVELHKIAGYRDGEIDIFILSPVGVRDNAPCLMFYHGGGFIFEGALHHYKLALIYAKTLNVKVVYVAYRLAPKFPFPYQVEDCYNALKWVVENADKLNIDKDNIAVYGDSAGGNISAVVALFARDRKLPIKLKFQALIYPFLDGSLESESALKFTDTPVWNSTLSKKIQKYLRPNYEIDTKYLFPIDFPFLNDLPPAYIETAEFDSLHDDGVTYAKRLQTIGIDVRLNETKGTMHGFDMIMDAPTTLKAIKARIDFMKEKFEEI